MPYAYTMPDDEPLAPPRNTTIPALWDEIKNRGRKSKPAAEKPKAEAATAQHLALLIAHISHQLTPIPGAIHALRQALQTVWPILYPHLPVTPPGAPS